MRKLGALLATVYVCGVTQVAWAHGGNPYLTATLKTVDKDVAVILEPTKNVDPSKVSNANIMAAVSRARTAAFQIQLIADRAGKFENGALAKNEMTPAIEDEPIKEQQEIMEAFAGYLPKAKTVLLRAEQQLIIEFKKDAKIRDFGPLKTTLGELDVILTDISKVISG